MCTTIPGRVTRAQGAMAEVESEGRTTWFNALAQPDVKVGDYVLSHANLIVAIISAEEAQRMLEAADEVRRLEHLEEEEQARQRPGAEAADETPSDGDS
jgi:hydrogenase assembly chaperone HypC/HupF